MYTTTHHIHRQPVYLAFGSLAVLNSVYIEQFEIV